MQEISNNAKLLEIHKLGRGLIFNDFSGTASSGKEYNILHNTSCSWVLKCNTNVHKLFFENEIEAIEWLSTNRVSNWKLCGTCKPSISLTSSNCPIKPSSSLETKGYLKSASYKEPITFWVKGEPSSFSTTREKPWKLNLEQQIPDNDGNGIEKGVVLDFHLGSMKVNGMYFDIDNLCEPVFSILINKKGWFGGKRPNLKWFRAIKLKDVKQGCCFKIYNSSESVSPISYGDVIYSKTYLGNLPKCAKDAEFISWIKENYTGLKHLSSFYVKIEFGSSTINLGDIATGRIKSIVDCLYPIIGGNKGSPEDWRINLLEVAKGVKTIQEESVKVSIAKL